MDDFCCSFFLLAFLEIFYSEHVIYFLTSDLVQGFTHIERKVMRKWPAGRLGRTGWTIALGPSRASAE